MDERMTGDGYDSGGYDGEYGTGEVHADISSQPSKGEGMSGKYGAAPSSYATDTSDDAEGVLEETTARVKNAAGAAIDEAASRAEDLRDRASGMASGIRHRAESLVDDAEGLLDRTGLPAKAQNYPLAALGIAFGVGFLLAGRTESRTMAMAKGQLRGIILGGIAASLKDEAAHFARAQLSSLVGGPRGDGAAY